jgi:hypothetical protein
MLVAATAQRNQSIKIAQRAVLRLQDSTADKAMHCLLLYDLAVWAAASYAAAEQRNKQQGRLDPHHVQLLQQLGLRGLRMLHADRDEQSTLHMRTARLVISRLLSNAASGSTKGSSSSSIRVGGMAGLQPLPAAAGAGSSSSSSSSSCGPLEAAAMLTVMQGMLLPFPGIEAAWFHDAAHTLYWLLDSLAPSARTAAAAVMLQPFVTQLLPAGISALKAAAAAVAGPASSSSSSAAGNALQPPSSTEAVTSPMPVQPPFLDAALVLKLWLSTGDPCRVGCMPQHLVLASTMPYILCSNCWKFCCALQSSMYCIQHHQ